MLERAEAKRGAVIVETAIIVGTILTLILFSVQIGVLGFLQVTVDAASFVNARGYALGATDPDGDTRKIFSQIGSSDLAPIAEQAAPQPSTAAYVDYGYNSTDPTEKANSASNRHGGSTTIQPTLYQAVASKGGTTGIMHLFDRTVGVSGQYSEPYYEECGAHYNVSNSAGTCGAKGTPSNFAVNYFSSGENTPPYYVGFNFIEHCTYSQPWTKCNNSYNFLALGVAEKLAWPNWTIPLPGVGLSAGLTSFQTAACHQRYYAGIAQFFAKYPNLIALYLVHQPTIDAELGNGGISDFGNFNGFDPATNAMIKQVYNWDRRVNSGYDTVSDPNADQEPLYENAGC